MSSTFRLRCRAALASAAVAAVAAGCAQPGTQAPRSEAARIAVATGDMSVACGYLEELTAFEGWKGNSASAIVSMADARARKLAGVYSHDQTDIYQGESIGAVVNDSVSLLHDCGLRQAQKTLERALSEHR